MSANLLSIDEAERLLRWHCDSLIRSYRIAYLAVKEAKRDETLIGPGTAPLIISLARDIILPAQREFEKYKERQLHLRITNGEKQSESVRREGDTSSGEGVEIGGDT